MLPQVDRHLHLMHALAKALRIPRARPQECLAERLNITAAALRRRRWQSASRYALLYILCVAKKYTSDPNIWGVLVLGPKEGETRAKMVWFCGVEMV